MPLRRRRHPRPDTAPPRRGHHVRDVERLAAVLCEPELFARRERAGSEATARYTLRESGLAAFLRHGSPDVGVLDEIFGRRWYDPPAPVTRLLAARPRPLRVVDLGANIGLFGLWAAGRLGPVEVTLYEPDRFNLAVLERTLEANGLDATWRLVRAAAADRPGTMAFHEGRYACSQAATPEDDGGAAVVPVVDALPELAGIDLLKMDMEGGEWSVLGDPRFAAAGVGAVALEYHPHLCPGPHARAVAERVLGDAGYAIEPLFERPEGVGMLWAWRERASGLRAPSRRPRGAGSSLSSRRAPGSWP
jgi:FkbM family methyltransferase